jgi:hypothetical protein
MASGLEAGTHQREADELLEIQQFRWSEVLELVRAGNLVDSKSLTTILFVQCFVKN